MTQQYFMPKSRVEAFSDGVIAIVITIMVLEMKVPHGDTLADLNPIIPVFLSYILSFLYLGIYWNNHHHLLHAAKHSNAPIMWANLHLLFWLSLIPFVTGWLGEHYTSAWPTAFYGIVLLMAAFAYLLLQTCIIKSHGKESSIASVFGRDWKGKISLLGYLSGILLSFSSHWIADGIYFLLALLWIRPDSRIEKIA